MLKPHSMYRFPSITPRKASSIINIPTAAMLSSTMPVKFTGITSDVKYL